MVIEVTHDLVRKIFKVIQGKGSSLFESFVFFDINNSNAVSKLEFKLGLQALGVNLQENEFNMIWNALPKTKNLKVRFGSYLKLFIDAGALQVIKFDESLETLLKKFFNIIQKLGNYEEAFRKFDKNK